MACLSYRTTIRFDFPHLFILWSVHTAMFFRYKGRLANKNAIFFLTLLHFCLLYVFVVLHLVHAFIEFRVFKIRAVPTNHKQVNKIETRVVL